MMPIMLHRDAPRKTVSTTVFHCGRAAWEPGCLLGEQLRSLAMERPVRWMTLGELRDELEPTRPAWEAQPDDLEGVLVEGQLPC